ncbi:carboxypeptidase-like protein [Mangrovibacterium marinum]|uniref:Carboxypeptidase-like protein n=1 Tax=Mangrovibacterium marinum TaxID=1639118 RepID=A0A2T5BPL2_9BACT|nr:carboxypeptidase-like regulatory domain-containing protein [Mangrovibacterium marinum]PTN00998.1 carboxypeptidase-like protein [Mangrovibacterium marinum]
MKQLLFIFSVLLVSCAYGQASYLENNVVDSHSGKPIPYANIWVLNTDRGTSSSVNGDFILKIDNEFKSLKKLKITAIGYFDTIIDISEIRDTIFLKPREYNIEEITIFPQMRNSLIVNPISKKTDKSYWICSNTPSIIGRYFKYQDSFDTTSFIGKIIVYSKKSLRKYDFNLHLYEYDTLNHRPGNDLIKENILVTTESKFGFGFTENVIDISRFKLQFPQNGLIIGLEWIMTKENSYDETSFEGNFTYKEKKYGPDFLVTNETENNRFLYMGKWFSKEIWSSSKSSPAISLVLTD